MEGEVIGAAERDVDEWSVSTYDDENDGPSAAATGDLEQEMKQAEEQEDPREKEEENDNEEEIMKSLQELDFELHAHMGKFNDILQKMESASVRDLQKAMKPRKRRKPKSAKKPISVLDLSEGDLSAKKTRKKTKKMKKGKESSDDSAQLQKSVGRKKKKSKTPMKPKHQQPEPDIIVVKVITPNARHGRRKDLEVESNEDMRRRGDYVQSEGESTPQSASQKKLRRKKKKRSKGEEDLDVASPWDRWHQDGRDRIRERRAHDESPLPKRPHSAQPHTSHEFGSKPVWERLYERHSGWPLVPGSPLCPQPAEPSPPHRFCTLRGRSPDKVRRPRPIITPGSPRTAIFDAFREPESPSPRRFIVGASKKERTRKPFLTKDTVQRLMDWIDVRNASLKRLREQEDARTIRDSPLILKKATPRRDSQKGKIWSRLYEKGKEHLLELKKAEEEKKEEEEREKKEAEKRLNVVEYVDTIHTGPWKSPNAKT